MTKQPQLTKKLTSWSQRRRTTAATLPIQQQAGALLMLDAFDDFLLEVKAEVEKAKATKAISGWLPASQAAKALHVSENTIRRWGRIGKVVVQQPAGHHKAIRYWVEPVEAEFF